MPLLDLPADPKPGNAPLGGGKGRAYVGSSPDREGRPISDFYQTPWQATVALLHVEEFSDGLVWEPACGKGAIARVMLKSGLSVYSSDLNDWGYGEAGKDFLRCEPPPGLRHLVTNPPFKIAEQFILRGNALIQETGGKMALLERTQFLEGLKRARLFEATKLARVWTLSRRIPRMNRPDYVGPEVTSLLSFSWFVWDAKHQGRPELGWADWKEASSPRQHLLEL